MGSHPWKTVTEWSPDVSAALERGQQEVFSRGEFGTAYWLAAMSKRMGRPPPSLPPMPVPNTIDEAREFAAEEGTGSILDVYRLAPEPAMAATGPFSAEVLREVVGADQPTLEQVEPALHGLYERLDRGESGYVVCYQDGEPSQILFIGMSFD